MSWSPCLTGGRMTRVNSCPIVAWSGSCIGWALLRTASARRIRQPMHHHYKGVVGRAKAP